MGANGAASRGAHPGSVKVQLEHPDIRKHAVLRIRSAGPGYASDLLQMNITISRDHYRSAAMCKPGKVTIHVVDFARTSCG